MTTLARTARSLSVAALAAFALGACTDESVDQLAAGQVAETLDSNNELSRILAPLEASPDLVGLGPATALTLQLLRAKDAFVQQNPGCVTVAVTGAAMDISFDGCRIPPLPFAAQFTADGSLRAELSIEAAGGLAVRLVVSVTIPGIDLTGPFRTRRIEGSISISQVISLAREPTQLDGDVALELDDGTHLGMELSLAYRADVLGCVDLTGGARLTGDALGEAAPISLSGEGVRRCRNQCPMRGDVELSYGRGELLAWTYTGQETATVTGPRGKRFELPLPCAVR